LIELAEPQAWSRLEDQRPNRFQHLSLRAFHISTVGLGGALVASHWTPSAAVDELSSHTAARVPFPRWVLARSPAELTIEIRHQHRRTKRLLIASATGFLVTLRPYFELLLGW
jgi:hypothetical protein